MLQMLMFAIFSFRNRLISGFYFAMDFMLNIILESTK